MTVLKTMKKEVSTLRNLFSNSNIFSSLFFFILIFLSFGLLMIYSASFILASQQLGDGWFFVKKQALVAVFGCSWLLCVSFIPVRVWLKISGFWVLGVLLLLSLVLWSSFGVRLGGARRWLEFGGWRFQPSEFAKVALLFWVVRQWERFQQGKVSHLFRVLWVPFLGMGLFLLQPDFGSALFLFVFVMLLLFLGGLSFRKWLLFPVLGGVGSVVILLLAPYRLRRVLAFLNPWQDPWGKGFQVIQSLIGFSQGGFWGAGLGSGQAKLFYLPQAHHDFLFSVIGEELGWLGVAAVVLAFGWLLTYGFWIGKKHFEQKKFSKALLAKGIVLFLCLQAALHMGVCLSLLPPKGLPLPLLSYGGSALFSHLWILGVLMRLEREAKGFSESQFSQMVVHV